MHLLILIDGGMHTVFNIAHWMSDATKDMYLALSQKTCRIIVVQKTV